MIILFFLVESENSIFIFLKIMIWNEIVNDSFFITGFSRSYEYGPYCDYYLTHFTIDTMNLNFQLLIEVNYLIKKM